jgi:hypothetical protein
MILADQTNELSEIDIFPNPTNDFVFIKNKANESLGINIYNLNGILLNSEVSNKEITRISLETLGSGVYFLKIVNDKTAKTFKIIKQ